MFKRIRILRLVKVDSVLEKTVPKLLIASSLLADWL